LLITKIDFLENEEITRVHFLKISKEENAGKIYLYKPDNKHSFEIKTHTKSRRKVLLDLNLSDSIERENYYEKFYKSNDLISFSLDFEYFDPDTYAFSLYEKGHIKGQTLWKFRNVKFEKDLSSKQKQEYLKYAVLDQDIELIKNILKTNVDINKDINKDGHTLLMLAAKYVSDIEIIELLIDKGANVFADSNIEANPIMMASMSNNVKVVKLLDDKGSYLSSETIYGFTPILYAAKYNPKPDVIKYLINNNANINSTNEDGVSALMFASGYNSYEVVKTLIDESTQVNKRDLSGRNSIYYAATYNPDSKIINLLVENGADVNSKNKKGLTPLMRASAFNNYEVVKVLIEHGADINSKTESGFTPILYAAKYSNDPKVIDILVENGAEIKGGLFSDIPNPLYQSAKYNNNPEITKKLIELGADPNDDYDNSPLIEAAENNNAEVVKVILKAGVDVNYQNSHGNTALHRASLQAEDPRIIELLLEYGADGTIENEADRKAIEYIDGFEMGFGVVSENEHLIETDAYWDLNDASY
jgi:ankyrin repeat protein